MPIVRYALDGFNSSIFAYGQTGSGKTYTMHNPSCETFSEDPENSELGLIPRILEHTFSQISVLREKGAKVTVRCSMVEIYNENVYDLLDPELKFRIGTPGKNHKWDSLLFLSRLYTEIQTN